MCIFLIAKPCKYYQSNRCPYAADVCNFAHVIAPPMEEESRALCRYYSAGKCSNGSQCRYRHPDDHGEVLPPYKPNGLRLSIPESHWHGAHPPHEKTFAEQSPLYGSPYYPQALHDWSYANGINVQSPVYLPLYGPPSQSGAHAVMGAGSKQDRQRQPSAMGASPITNSTSRSSYDSTFSRPSVDEQDDRLSTGSSSSLSSTSPSIVSDHQLIIATTEDPKYSEHTHEYQSRVVITEQPRPMHVPPSNMVVMPPPFYGAQPARYPGAPVEQPLLYTRQPHPSQHQHGHQYGATTPVRYGAVTPVRSVRDPSSNPGSRAASRSSNRIKASKYKTKPCKFWAMDGTCPSGMECTFQHDEVHIPPVPPLPPSIRPQKTYSSATSKPMQVDSYVPPHQPQARAYHPPHEPISPPRIHKDSSHDGQNTNSVPPTGKKEFIPVAWRVIGGGVRIGNPVQRDNLDASTPSLSSDSEPDHAHRRDSEGGEERDREGGFDMADLDRSLPALNSDQAGKSAGHGGSKHGTQAARGSGDTGGRDRSGSGTASANGGPSRTRKRSNSIPSTPSTAQFIVGNLFSAAESPGVL
ncbi:hypothetical protein D9611_010982 [Ephemerocybe angulata]|uniref:C3H1-type domain-containing protein n=1 Tax=Ephemerocybe angulata TaxID=980116 RepID=A0A8H5BCJ6_9AGAR|nr:hypothetical protein D9611_010982 [Tulosesus angulatus]